ncbi:MAG: ATP-grasp domain-containing protein [Hoeflea sp.]|uniref:ATP-grasp domain-containing protein n=1 Tax=Hoeflea sp. TaxID=1940281 RepID=UPI00329A3C17
MKNVLLTSSGAKVPLTQCFRKAASERGDLLYTADIAETCIAALFSDGYVRLPRTDPDSETYAAALLAACRQNGITLVVPTRDGELVLLAKLAEEFAGERIRILVSPPESIAICRDKIRFTKTLQKYGLPVLPAVEPDEAASMLPVFVRARDGAGGRGAMAIRDPSGIEAAGDLSGYLINRLVDTARSREFTIDTLMSLDGRPVQAVARSRDMVVDGESVISTVVEDPELEALSLELCERIGLCGHNTVQAFRLEDGEPSFIEVNPRFGGASSLSIAAGLDSPARVIALAAGDMSALNPRPIIRGTRLVRYKTDMFQWPGNKP